MSTYIGSFLHRITLSNTIQLIWLGTMILVILTLAILHHIWKADLRKIRVWRALCFIPLVLAVIHFFIYSYGYQDFISGYSPIYMIGLIVLFPIPFAKHKIGYCITAWITGIALTIFGFYYMTMAPNSFNHTRESLRNPFTP